jgi:predicted amidohydrolase
MGIIRIALLQLTACGNDQDGNLAKGEVYCRRAQAMGADIALFPELWNIGYTFDRTKGLGASDDRSGQQNTDLWRAPKLWNGENAGADLISREVITKWQDQAVGRDSRFVTHFRRLAQELNMAIALTYLERWTGPPRNSVSLIDRHGDIVMTYAKVHTCDFDFPDAACTPGDDFPVCELETAQGSVKVGAMICYDREFPESARALMLKGAEIILTPNACPLDENRIGQFRARAFENMVGVAMANYAEPWGGRSVAFDPMAYAPNGDARDTLVIQAGRSEEIYLASFDLDAIRAYRRRETLGNAFRRPHRYGLLTSPAVESPFDRVNAAGEPYDRTNR